MRGCKDEKMWRWEDVKMRGCEDDEKMWRWENVKMRCEDEKMFYRPPLLEEPCAQTLSGKKKNSAFQKEHGYHVGYQNRLGWTLGDSESVRICQIDLIKKYKDLMFHHCNKKLGPNFTISLPDLKLSPRFTQCKALLPPKGARFCERRAWMHSWSILIPHC